MNQISESKKLKRKTIAGRILTGMVTAVLLASGMAKIGGVPAMVDGLTRAGIPLGAIVPIGALELSCLALYLIPRTAVLGMLLLTGYFGGAAVTHIIGRENFLPPLFIGLWVWGSTYLRVPALQELLPLKKSEANPINDVRVVGGQEPLVVARSLDPGYGGKER